MPIIKKDDVTPERPVIIVLYGQPGSGKTSVATTAEVPLLVDTDRGYDRSVQRVDTLVANRWEDILGAQNDMSSYKTIIVDTAKATLDDYLSTYAVQTDYKLAKNTLKKFGRMADDFKAFVNVLRQNGSDIIFICHDKEQSEGDVIKHSPDCTGQSKDLLLRIADQVGFISLINAKRTVSFEPNDNYVGKNVAQIPMTEIPDATSPEFATFMADIIKKVKQSIQSKSEAQRKANELITKLRGELAKVDDDESAAKLLADCKELPQIMKQPFFNEINTALTAKGFVFTDNKFTKPSEDKKSAAKKSEKKEDAKPADDGKSSKPLVRVTTIEAFRRYIDQSEHDNYEITEQSVIDNIVGEFHGNEYTRVGTAFHAIVETGCQPCVVANSGYRTFTYYGKEKQEPVPEGRTFDIEGYHVTLDLSQIKVAMDYRYQNIEAFHEIRKYKDYGRAVVTGCADMVNGLQLRDIKTKYSAPSDSQYYDSFQWRFYLDMFGADIFDFDLFCFDGYKLEKHGYDVRGLPLIPYTPAIRVYRYEGMEQDIHNLLDQFLDWCELRGLTQYLYNTNV